MDFSNFRLQPPTCNEISKKVSFDHHQVIYTRPRPRPLHSIVFLPSNLLPAPAFLSTATKYSQQLSLQATSAPALRDNSLGLARHSWSSYYKLRIFLLSRAPLHHPLVVAFFFGSPKRPQPATAAHAPTRPGISLRSPAALESYRSPSRSQSPRRPASQLVRRPEPPCPVQICLQALPQPQQVRTRVAIAPVDVATRVVAQVVTGEPIFSLSPERDLFLSVSLSLLALVRSGLCIQSSLSPSPWSR